MPSSFFHQVHLELLYCPYGTQSSFKNPFNPDFQLTTLEKAIRSGTDGTGDPSSGRTSPKKNVIVRGVLSVTVIAAENLPATDLNGKADPYVVLIMKKSEKKAKTRVSSRFLINMITTMFLFYFFRLFLIIHSFYHLFKESGTSKVQFWLTRSLLIITKKSLLKFYFAGKTMLIRSITSSTYAFTGPN